MTASRDAFRDNLENAFAPAAHHQQPAGLRHCIHDLFGSINSDPLLVWAPVKVFPHSNSPRHSCEYEVIAFALSMNDTLGVPDCTKIRKEDTSHLSTIHESSAGFSTLRRRAAAPKSSTTTTSVAGGERRGQQVCPRSSQRLPGRSGALSAGMYCDLIAHHLKLPRQQPITSNPPDFDIISARSLRARTLCRLLSKGPT